MKKELYTPHINAYEDSFAKTVLMPGDPLRSKFIAENFLDDAVLVNNVRGIQGYTGTYKGKKISVMASGMGIPSIGIYSYELFNFYNVDNIIRVGSAGAISDKIKVGDIVIGMGACTNSNFADQFDFPGTYAPIASYELMKRAIDECERSNATYHVGNLFSSDVFYDDDKGVNEKRLKLGVLAIEMEAAGLYATAARANKNALAICTVSDHIFTGESMSAIQRQTSLTDMITIALETAISLED